MFVRGLVNLGPSLRFLRPPKASFSVWSRTDDLQHTYSVKEFERQVYARLGTIDGVERMSEYDISTPTGDYNDIRAHFANRFKEHPIGFRWSKFKSNKGTNEDGATGAVECDLFLRCKEPTLLADVFKDCADQIVSLSPQPLVWNEVTTTEDRRVLLCEIAETPENLREKLWQLERALSCGPEDLRSPAALVVCLNGDKVKFDAATCAMKKYFDEEEKDELPAIARFPLFAIWTPYRNTYAEVKQLHLEVKQLHLEVQELHLEVQELQEGQKQLHLGQERQEKQLAGQMELLQDIFTHLTQKS